MRSKVLKAITVVDAVVAVVSACCVDSEGFTAFAVFTVAVICLLLTGYVHERGDMSAG